MASFAKRPCHIYTNEKDAFSNLPPSNNSRHTGHTLPQHPHFLSPHTPSIIVAMETQAPKQNSYTDLEIDSLLETIESILPVVQTIGKL